MYTRTKFGGAAPKRNMGKTRKRRLGIFISDFHEEE
jgi:hypothetical protein